MVPKISIQYHKQRGTDLGIATASPYVPRHHDRRRCNKELSCEFLVSPCTQVDMTWNSFPHQINLGNGIAPGRDSAIVGDKDRIIEVGQVSI